MASIKIKDFFNGRFFEIPKYQRGYAWEVQNIRELFDDVIESIESNSNHYIGTIVLSKSEYDDEKFYVVDGQQRITTTTLIISALIKELSDKDQAYYERFYLKEDERYRLKPLNRDCSFLTDILDSKIGEPQNKSQRYLKDVYQEIKFKVEAIEDKLKFLKSVEKLEVMEFVENSEGDAIRIFQTVNDRGKPLSNMEKAKSLLIYFSNRYLCKRLDNQINDCFSDIFEIYDDVKHLGEELNITLIKSKEFNEDNLMRYHFVSYSDENYDPTASYVLQFLKTRLTNFRNNSKSENYEEMENFINSYTKSLKTFFEGCKSVIYRAKSDPKYFKLFVIFNLSATLYPLIIKLEMLNLLDRGLEYDEYREYTFYHLLELIEVRVYKTRATDPKADISRLIFHIENKTPLDIQNWLLWFNSRWMPKEEFQSHLFGWIFGNRALNHIFINYCEELNAKEFNVDELLLISNKNPNIEHILAQTPTFAPRALGFKNKEDFIRSTFLMTKKIGCDIDTNKTFSKSELQARTKMLAEYCLQRWWC